MRRLLLIICGALSLPLVGVGVASASPTPTAATKVADPYRQQAELMPTDEIGDARTGNGVALSSKGNVALVGGPNDGEGVGAAWVFIRHGSRWRQEAKLTGPGESGKGQFGESIAISGDGKTVLIGAPEANGGLGAAWVFRRAANEWRRRGSMLTGAGDDGTCPPNSEGFCSPGQVRFGESVALPGDGKTALIGGPGDTGEEGAAWVFIRWGSTWIQQGAKLVGGEEQNFNERFFHEQHIGGQFGQSVALSSDGDTALIGGPRDNTSIYGDEGPRSEGAVWAFVRSGAGWIQQGPKLTGIGGESPIGRALGRSVALSSDGNTALAGGPYADWPNPEGAAWVFTRAGATWTQQGERLKYGEPPEGEDVRFGMSVALSGTGDSALVGDDPLLPDVLATGTLFQRSGSSWAGAALRLTCGGEGSSVALSADASTALLGTTVYVNTAKSRAERHVG